VKPIIIALSIGLLAATAYPANKPRTIEGRITDYSCGDNCYLTITDSKGAKHTGLCEAPQCNAWNDRARMPSNQKGKRVTVTVRRGAQRNDAGEIMDHMDAFTRIEYSK